MPHVQVAKETWKQTAAQDMASTFEKERMIQFKVLVLIASGTWLSPAYEQRLDELAWRPDAEIPGESIWLCLRVKESCIGSSASGPRIS